MDERVLERMITRAKRSITDSSTLPLAAGSIFLSAIFWIILRMLLGGIGGVFHLPLLIIAASFTLLPLSLVFVPLALSSLGARSGHEMLPFTETIKQQWKSSVALFLYAFAIAIVQLLLGVIVAVWCGIEAVPVLGTVVYLFFSWVPTVLTLLMGIAFVIHIILLLTLAPYLAENPSIELRKVASELRSILTREWLLRIKLLCIGIIPSAIFYSVCAVWTMKGLPQSIEFCASIFRVAAFSIIEAPLFMFLVHMAVEADRYTQWLSSRRVE